ncbi:HAD family hydrolase [Candidatus Uhrbacteria bacterium]|nr:HAD family hydrolase [Candidatus Uhrbacteria bacterium]
MSKHFVLDFDGTLFNTDVLWQWIINRFSQEGLEWDSIINEGEKLFAQAYTVERHARKMGLDDVLSQKISNEFDLVTDQESSALVYPDVIPFLEDFPIENKSILTFGEEVFQKAKIKAAKIDSRIGSIRIAGPEYQKTKHLKELLEIVEHPILFIDDNPRELLAAHEAGLPIELVRMRRPGARHALNDHEMDSEVWRVISSLAELE